MGMGIWELVLLLFFLAPDGPVGQPASSAQVFTHVPNDSVLVLSADLASLGQGANTKLDRLLEAPFVEKTPAFKQAAAAVSMGRRMMEAEFDKLEIDVFKDIRYAVLCFTEDPEKGERGMVIAGDKIPQQAFDKLVEISGAKPKGRVFVAQEDRSGPQVLARTEDGTVLFGDQEWVEMALDGKHRHPGWKKLLADHNRKTYFMLAVKLSKNIKEDMQRELEPAFKPLVTGIEGISVRMQYRGSSFRILTSSPKAARVWGGILEGMGKIMVAYHEAAEGFLLMGESFLSSLDPPQKLFADLHGEEGEILGALVANRKEIHKMAKRLFLGTGKPRARTKVRPAARSATLDITGRGPGSMIMLPAAMGWLFFVSAASDEAVKVEAVEAMPPPQPAAPQIPARPEN